MNKYILETEDESYPTGTVRKIDRDAIAEDLMLMAAAVGNLGPNVENIAIATQIFSAAAIAGKWLK